MSEIAVDVVLLPDPAVAQSASAANARLVERFGRHIVLDRDHLPHISLAMGCIDADDTERIGRALARVASECPPGELAITGIATTLSAGGRQVSSFILAQTQPLQVLHERIMAAMQADFSNEVTPEMVYGDEDVAETTLAWIRHYRQKAAFKAFFPHITLGYGRVDEPMTFPMACAAQSIAVCHLGNHCTCRKILTSVEL